MSTFGVMQTRIASDLERSLADASFAGRTWGDEIKAAINDAIKLHKAKKWWFLQGPIAGALTSATTPSDSYVSEYAGLVKLDSLRITIAGNKEPLDQITFTEMEARHDGTDSAGQPYEYCRHAGRVRLYPTPSIAYTLTWSGTFEETTLTADADTNDWMTLGELVIRSQAKVIMLRDYIKSYDDVPGAQLALKDAMKALDAEHVTRTATSRLRARC